VKPKPVDGDVGVLVKAMDVLDALADESPLTVAELVARTGVSKPAAYRIVQTMERRAYLVREADRGRYSLGPALYGLGRVARSSTNLVRAARPAMETLSAEFDETVNLGVLSSGDVIYVDTIDSDQHLRTSVPIAHRDSVYSTALGKAMLAALPDDSLESYLADFAPARRTINTKVTRSAFVDDLEVTRARGYSLDDEENEIGSRCVASAIIGDGSQPVAAMSVSAPTSRATYDVLDRIGLRLVELCRDLSDSLR
jgi:IclR family transcriptional regulator, acetate operon repressor